MKLNQYYLGCLAHASYMIVDDRTKVAAVVDPQRDVDQYLKDAEENGWTIRYVFLTHFHADFVAGHIELRDKTGAHIYLGAKSEAEYDFTPVKDGDVVEFGSVRISVLETPGHTPEGITLVVKDMDSNEPAAALTGDTLFIGDVGRPDLMASIGVTAHELGEMLYESIHDKLMKLPDDTLVYPAHGAGSLCGKQLSEERVSTIGEQKQFNYALQPMSREDFIKIVTAEQPDAPDYFLYDATMNRKERPNLEESLKENVRALSLEAVLKHRASGSQVIDVREAIDFEGAHLAGSTNIGLHGKYATWCGSILNHSDPIIVIAENGDEEEAIMRLGRIGFDNVAGYLDGGMASLEGHDDEVITTDRITAPALAEVLNSDDKPFVLDVRAEAERVNVGLIEGSYNIPLNHLVERIDEVPADEPIYVHCAGGYRSAIAASLLEQHGRKPIDLVGGYQAWEASTPATASA